MKSFFAACLIAFSLLLAPLTARAQDYEALFRDFDARALTATDKRFLQTALAFEGHYNGLLDGAWGKISRQAMSRYSWAEYGTETENWHMATLAWSFAQRVKQDGWQMKHLPGLNVSLLWPQNAYFTDAPSENFYNYRHANSSLSISFGIHSKYTAQSIHDYTIDTHQAAGRPYSVRKSNLAVSSSTKRDGSTLYARSDFINGSWSTIMLFAAQQDASILNAVAASLTPGHAAPLRIDTEGKLADTITKAIAFLESDEQEPRPTTRAAPPPEHDNHGSSGTGFIVSGNGHVLTNEHVVAGCTRITIDGAPATLQGTSRDFDLALLQATSVSGKQAAIFAAQSAKLNSDVTAVGFPYAGLLGGLNVTRGSVSSLKGLGGDATTMQITAPVQSGNSGGPLLSPDGEVVGVVVSKLDATKVADAMGDVPQNVNFAIRGEIARLFLAQNGVDPTLSLTDTPLPPEALAQKAQSFTVFVECR
ncbi:serine protease [Aliishimia ponticola]|uniref:Serine protease n=1 Tax=Aliishimia ponticola TaxID=2499833 RepID=A0A4S4NCD2_9RHOB|nr:serine protease [Aliishimia ponticola]THH37086.1 serine protease [Aliishimia ponticola]